MGHDHDVDAHRRLVPLTGAFNFRDLGGYPTADGRVTRWGRLFRSDTLHELTGPDVDAIASLGITTIIDLRTDAELARTGRGPLADRPIRFHHLPVFRDGGGEAMAAPVPVGDELSERYLWYLEAGRQTLVEALTLVADAARLPLVFHCAAGKDRTGVLAALVLDILEVDPDVIVADYVLTAERMPLIIGRYRSDPVLAERMAAVPASRFGVEPASMERFLSGLHRQHGGARAWAESAGLPPQSLDGLTDLLTEPA